MNLKIKSNRIMIDVSVLFIVLSSYFYLTVSYRKYQKILLILGVFIGLMSEFALKRDFYFDLNKRFKAWFWIVCLVWGLAGLMNGEITLVANAVALFGIYYVFCEIYSRSSINVEIFLWVICAIYLWFIIWSYICVGIAFSSYKGITYNSNAFGGISAGVFCFCFSYFISEATRQFEKVMSLFICAISLFNTIISSSRTSFVTCAGVGVVGIILCRKDIITFVRKNKEIVLLCGVVFLLMIIVAVKRFDVEKIFYDAIVAKFIRKKDNPFDGRAEVWMQVWREKTLWGHGRDYFDNIGLGAHNTFISILGQYGIVAVVVYIGFILSSLNESVRFLRSNCEYRVIPILSTIAFIMMSMAEGMLMKINMLIFYFGLTIVLRYNRVEGERYWKKQEKAEIQV